MSPLTSVQLCTECYSPHNDKKKIQQALRFEGGIKHIFGLRQHDCVYIENATESTKKILELVILASKVAGYKIELLSKFYF